MMDEKALRLLLDTGAGRIGVQTSVDGILPHYVRPDGQGIVAVPDYLFVNPRRIREGVSVYDTNSFVKYFSDYCTKDSRIFVNTQAPSVIAVLDYHKAGDDATIKAQWGEHRLNYVFRETPEWTTWKSKSKVSMQQVDFARFIEDNLPDIVNPPQTTMLDLARTFQAKKDVTFNSATDLQNGAVQFLFSEELRGGAGVKAGDISIPDAFTINVAPYEGSDKVNVRCRFRYTLDKDELKLRYELERAHKIVDQAVTKAIEQLKQGITGHEFTNGVLAPAK